MAGGQGRALSSGLIPDVAALYENTLLIGACRHMVLFFFRFLVYDERKKIGRIVIKMKYGYQYEIGSDGVVHIIDLPFKTKYVEVPREDRFRKLYSYVLIKIDLTNALKYLKIAACTTDPIVKDGLFKIAVVLYIKCFSPTQHGGRSNIAENVIYKDIPGEPIKCHDKFKDMRNKYIAHDENDFLESQLGIVLNTDEKRICGVAYIEKQAQFSYGKSIEILQELCRTSIEKVEKMLEIETEKVHHYLNERDFDVINEYPELKVQLEPETM